ncbi:MAG TPA: hypothetical protein VFO34_17340 [Candidatus Acidoferrales bacterium]|nr:hypothetical protein [Candidatus Acidoferrales bacterium]
MAGKYKRTRREEDWWLEVCRRILRSGDEMELMRVLRKNGLRDEDPRFAEAVKIFRELRAGKR